MIPPRIAVVLCCLLASNLRAIGAAGAETPPAPGASQSDPAATAVLALAVRGSQSVDYEGTQSVSVRGPEGTEKATLRVARGEGNRMLIEVQPAAGVPGWVLAQQGNERVTVDSQGHSVTRAQTALASDIEPAGDVRQLLRNYRVALDGSVSVLDHRAWVLRIQRLSDSALAERWVVDAQTGLLLDRQIYGARGQVERAIAFTEVREPYAPPAADLRPPVPAPGVRTTVNHAALSPAMAPGLARQAGLPATLPGGFVLRSAARITAGHGTMIQLMYFDGLEEVSLFQQPGLLGVRSVPAGARKVRLRRVMGYVWDGFPHGAAWQAGPNTDTLVGDAPPDQLERIAQNLPQGPMRQGLLTRLRRLFDWL